MMEIDREIHKLLGNCVHGDYYGPSDSPYSQCGKCHTWITSEKDTEILKYSTDIAAAFEVIDWLNVNGWSVTMFSAPSPNPNPRRHYVGVRKPIMSVDKYRVDAETLPLAICQAALKLKENVYRTLDDRTTHSAITIIQNCLKRLAIYFKSCNIATVGIGFQLFHAYRL